MRVVSLVPSWTETLIVAGVEVVGRTRFCVHPEDRIKRIPVVGGTKDLSPGMLEQLAPDLVVLDREENTKEMAEQITARKFVSHVDSIHALVRDLDTLATLTGNQGLLGLARAWRQLSSESFASLPVLDWIRKPDRPPRVVLYLIWKKPWMTVSRDTFIGDMLSLFGVELLRFSEKYPKIDLEAFSPRDTLLLFSSEPFPFAERRAELEALPFPCALLDGESYSWFGVRSLNFLQNQPK